MARVNNWRIYVFVFAIASLLAWLVHALSGLNLWVCGLLVVIGIGINGWIATMEDEMPGGFCNPEPDTRRHKTQ